MLSILLLHLVRYQACRSYQTTWLGLSPLYLVQTTSLVCWLFVFMPRAVHKGPPVLQASTLPALTKCWADCCMCGLSGASQAFSLDQTGVTAPSSATILLMEALPAWHGPALPPIPLHAASLW